MRYWILLAALLTGGCSTSFLTFEPLQALQEPKAVEVREGVLQPQRSVNQLLLERLAVCNTPPEEQDAVLNKLLTTDQKPPANGVDENKLDALMLASCRPARTRVCSISCWPILPLRAPGRRSMRRFSI
jgi:hypothetical protein